MTTLQKVDGELSRFGTKSPRQAYVQICEEMGVHVQKTVSSMLSDASRDWDKLRIFDCDACLLGPKGCMAILPLLLCSRSLRRVSLQSCQITDEFVTELTEMLQDHGSIRIVDISDNPLITIYSANPVINLLRTNKNIVRFSVENTHMGANVSNIINNLCDSNQEKVADYYADDYFRMKNVFNNLDGDGSGWVLLRSLVLGTPYPVLQEQLIERIAQKRPKKRSDNTICVDSFLELVYTNYKSETEIAQREEEIEDAEYQNIIFNWNRLLEAMDRYNANIAKEAESNLRENEDLFLDKPEEYGVFVEGADSSARAKLPVAPPADLYRIRIRHDQISADAAYRIVSLAVKLQAEDDTCAITANPTEGDEVYPTEGNGEPSKEGNGDYPTEENAERQTEGNGHYPTEENAEKATEENAEKATEENAEKATEEKAEKATEGNGHYPTEENAEKATEGNGHYPTEENAEKATEGNGHYPTEDNGEHPTEGSGANPRKDRDYPTEDNGECPAAETEEKPTVDGEEAPAKERSDELQLSVVHLRRAFRTVVRPPPLPNRFRFLREYDEDYIPTIMRAGSRLVSVSKLSFLNDSLSSGGFASATGEQCSPDEVASKRWWALPPSLVRLAKQFFDQEVAKKPKRRQSTLVVSPRTQRDRAMQKADIPISTFLSAEFVTELETVRPRIIADKFVQYAIPIEVSNITFQEMVNCLNEYYVQLRIDKPFTLDEIRAMTVPEAREVPLDEVYAFSEL